MNDTVRLVSGSATADIALRGAEPVSWRVDGRELLWSGDPVHWEFHAPILFPLVGASRGGAVRVEGRDHPMPQHGFARRSTFTARQLSDSSARLRLAANDETRKGFPFQFELEVTATLAPDSLSLSFEVRNAGAGPMSYAIGFHPAFPLPLDGTARDGHRVVFEAEESALVPEIAPGGLLARRSRPIPLRGRELPLSPDLFKEALVFLNARSRAFRFQAPSGAAIRMDAENLRHLAVWSRPDAPFLSLEAWSGHADWEDAAGELAERASMLVLAPGGVGRHAVTMRWTPPA